MQEQHGAAPGIFRCLASVASASLGVDGLVAGVEDQPVHRLQDAVQGAVGQPPVEQVGGERGQDVRALHRHRLAVGGAQPLDDVDPGPCSTSKIRASWASAGTVRRSRSTAPGRSPRASMSSVNETSRSGISILGRPRTCPCPGRGTAALRYELVDPLADGHAGQPVPGAQLALRRYRGVDGQLRALDQVEQDGAELEVLRYGTVRVDGRHGVLDGRPVRWDCRF